MIYYIYYLHIIYRYLNNINIKELPIEFFNLKYLNTL